MSAVVLPFVGKPKAAASTAKSEATYYCLRCSGDTFKALENGRMHCAKCGAGMNNIFVSTKPESA